MYRYILKRLLMLIPVVLGVILIIFFVMDLAPGDPVYMVASSEATDEELEALRVELGLSDSFFVRYFKYVNNMLHGSLGTSYITKRSVMQTYFERLPATLMLSSAAIFITIAISIPLGITAAVHQNTLRDTASMVFALIGISMPAFWLGLLLMLFFALQLGWLPSGGNAGFSSIILPAFTVGIGQTALMTRTTRSSMLDVIRQDYLRTARAKGVPEIKVIRKHALKNALIPIITVFGVQFSYFLGGSVLAETVFSWPGVGRMIVDGISQRDIPTVTGGIVMTTILVSIVNLIIDIVYAYVDPRIKAQYTK